MAESPKSLTREEFFEVVADYDQIPKLFNRIENLMDQSGLRAVKSGLVPRETAVWLWPDRLCLMQPALFDEIAKTIGTSDG